MILSSFSSTVFSMAQAVNNKIEPVTTMKSISEPNQESAKNSSSLPNEGDSTSRRAEEVGV